MNDATIDNSFNTAICEKGWFNAKRNPPEVGYIVKRWKSGALWVGYFNGDPKMANCDWWYPLDIPD